MCLGNIRDKMWNRTRRFISGGRVEPTPYPENMGFGEKKGGGLDARFGLLSVGVEVQRILPMSVAPEKDMGYFMSNPGATPEQCSIPTTGKQKRVRLLVMKDIPVTAGKVAPWTHGNGGATQYVPVIGSISWLIMNGHLKVLGCVLI